MIALDAPRWSQLATAYGTAEDVPAQLRRLAADPTDGAAHEYLWGALIHQGDVHQAAFAAAPHVWPLAVAAADADARASLLSFVHAVAASGFDPAYLPPDVRTAYVEWRARAQREAAVELATERELQPAIALLGIAASDTSWGAVLGAVAADSVLVSCRACGEEDMVVTLHDGVRAREDVAVTPAAANAVGAETAPVLALARSSACRGLATLVLAVEGTVPCARCGEPCDVLGASEVDDA